MTELNEFNDDEKLVTAMTRPAMLGGLSLTSIGISCFAPVLIALITRSVYPFGAIIVTLAFSYFVCLKDVYLFEIAFSAIQIRALFRIHVTKRVWGCRRYAPR